MTGEKRKASSVEDDWEADRKAEDVPQLSRDLSKKLKTDMDTEKAEEEGFPERAYKACPAHLNKVTDRLGEHIDSHSELEKAYQRLLEENTDLKRKLAEALASKPPQDPTTKTKPGPLPHHLHAQITDTTPAVEQGHFRYESHVDLLVGNLLTHYFPLPDRFYVGAQQTFMTGTAADLPMIEIANSWSMCVEPLDTTRTTDTTASRTADTTTSWTEDSSGAVDTTGAAEAPDPTGAVDSSGATGPSGAADTSEAADSTGAVDTTGAAGFFGAVGTSEEADPTGAVETTMASFDEENSDFGEISFLNGLATTSTPLRHATLSFDAPQDPWSDLDDLSFDHDAAPDLTTSPHLDGTNPTSSASVDAASPATHVLPSGPWMSPSFFDASPVPTVSSPLAPAQDPFSESSDHAASNPTHAPPPSIVISPPAEPSSLSLAASGLAAPTTSQMLPSGSQANPLVRDGSYLGTESDLSQDEDPSLDWSVSEMDDLGHFLKSFTKDSPPTLGQWNVVDDTGRYIYNKSGRAKIKRADFRVSLLESENLKKHRIFRNLVVVEDKLRLSRAAVAQLLSYMEELEEGGGNRFALGLAVVFTTGYKLKVAMFRREEEDEPIKNIGGTYEHVHGMPHVQLKWYDLNSVEVREQLLAIWQEEMEALGSVRSY